MLSLSITQTDKEIFYHAVSSVMSKESAEDLLRVGSVRMPYVVADLLSESSKNYIGKNPINYINLGYPMWKDVLARMRVLTRHHMVKDFGCFCNEESPFYIREFSKDMGLLSFKYINSTGLSQLLYDYCALANDMQNYKGFSPSLELIKLELGRRVAESTWMVFTREQIDFVPSASNEVSYENEEKLQGVLEDPKWVSHYPNLGGFDKDWNIVSAMGREDSALDLELLKIGALSTENVFKKMWHFSVNYNSFKGELLGKFKKFVKDFLPHLIGTVVVNPQIFLTNFPHFRGGGATSLDEETAKIMLDETNAQMQRFIMVSYFNAQAVEKHIEYVEQQVLQMKNGEGARYEFYLKMAKLNWLPMIESKKCTVELTQVISESEKAKGSGGNTGGSRKIQKV